MQARSYHRKLEMIYLIERRYLNTARQFFSSANNAMIIYRR